MAPSVGAATPPRAELIHTGFFTAGEPNIGISGDGTIYSTVMQKVVRSIDKGKHFTDVTPAGHATTLDPYLYVDKATGRVYKSDLAGTCQLLSWSDDRGATWTTAPAACNLSDHQSITSARPVTSPTVGYPNVVYNCSQTVGYNGYSFASGCDKSLNGGATFTPTGSFPFSDPGAESGDSGVPLHCPPGHQRSDQSRTACSSTVPPRMVRPAVGGDQPRRRRHLDPHPGRDERHEHYGLGRLRRRGSRQRAERLPSGRHGGQGRTCLLLLGGS